MNVIRLRSPVTKPLLAFGTPKAKYDRSTFRVTSPFAQRGEVFHGALDMGDYGSGSDVVAVADGKVIAAGYLKMPWSQPTTQWPSGNYGGLMSILEIAPRVVAIYAHFGSLAVKVGQQVTAGQLLGVVGDTGSAQSEPHLHFGLQAPAELIPAGIKTNPTIFGYGLDVDPWPFISGAAVLGDDMRLKGTFVRHLTNRSTKLLFTAHFRAGVETGDDASQAVFKTGTTLYPIVVVTGQIPTGSKSAEWYGAWAWVDGFYRFGYVHSSVVGELVPIEAVPKHGIPAAIADPLLVQISDAQTALDSAKTHLGKVGGTVAAGRVE